MNDATQLVTAGRHPERFAGMVNTPVFRTSTVLAETMAEWTELKRARAQDVAGVSTYGRMGTPTTHAFEEAMAGLEGGFRSLVFPSGLAAIATTLTALLGAGEEVLVPDTAYAPTVAFLTKVLARFGVQVRTYDPTVGGEIRHLLHGKTRVVYLESPTSQTFEMQDVPAIAAAAHAIGAIVVMDNTWGTPLYFKAFRHGVDVTIHAATKYIVGHSDAMLGVVTCNEATWPRVSQTTRDMGQTAGPDDIYLALRGLRTMEVRLQRHWEAGLEIAQWLEQQPQVEAVLHPGLSSHPGHALWKRDYLGACGLFGMVLRTKSEQDVAAFIDHLKLFGLGMSWGGFESLAIPVAVDRKHLGARWPFAGSAIRLHVGLEDMRDLKADLLVGLSAIREEPSPE